MTFYCKNNPNHRQALVYGRRVICRECHRLQCQRYRQKKNPAARPRTSTQCKHGHDLTKAANVYRDPTGYRRCRPCQRDAQRNSRQNRRHALQHP